MTEGIPDRSGIGDLHRLLEEGVGVVHAVRAEQAEHRRAIASLELAIAALIATIGELATARRADRELLQKILEACTREAGGELQAVLRHLEAAITTMGRDVRIILAAVEPPPPPG